LLVPGVKTQVISASMLTDGKVLKTYLSVIGLIIDVPVDNPSTIASVIKVEIRK